MSMGEDPKSRGNGEGNIQGNLSRGNLGFSSLNNTGSNHLIIKEDLREGRQDTRNSRAKSVKELRSIAPVSLNKNIIVEIQEYFGTKSSKSQRSNG
jgi:hypothetical protein